MNITINATTTVSKQTSTGRLSSAFPGTCILISDELLCIYRVGQTKHSRDDVLLARK